MWSPAAEPDRGQIWVPLLFSEHLLHGNHVKETETPRCWDGPREGPGTRPGPVCPTPQWAHSHRASYADSRRAWPFQDAPCIPPELDMTETAQCEGARSFQKGCLRGQRGLGKMLAFQGRANDLPYVMNLLRGKHVELFCPMASPEGIFRGRASSLLLNTRIITGRSQMRGSEKVITQRGGCTAFPNLFIFSPCESK